jgi:hypothetical protein
MADPARWYDSMSRAAAAGLAPKVWYMGADDRICITGFVDAKPFPVSDARRLLPATLRQLHALPQFPFRINYLDVMDGVVQQFRAADMLPQSMTATVLDQYARIAAAYPRNPEDQVACHNDLKPDNILFDGRRCWLVDWEAAFLNDRYADLAVVANFVVTNYAEEQEYLRIYFGPELSDYHHARFFLMQQLMHVFYFTFFMRLVSPDGKPVDLNIARPDFRWLHHELWEGRVDLADRDARLQYALVHMEQLRHNLQSLRFEESLAIVAGAAM